MLDYTVIILKTVLRRLNIMIRCFYCNDFLDIDDDEYTYEIFLRKYHRKGVTYTLNSDKKMYICEKCYISLMEDTED